MTLTLPPIVVPPAPGHRPVPVDQRLDMLAADLRDLKSLAQSVGIDAEAFARRVDLIRAQLQVEAEADV